MMTRRNNRPKMITIAVPEYLHSQLVELSMLFHLGIGETTERVCANGIKNIIDVMIADFKAKINQLNKIGDQKDVFQ